MIGIDLEKQFEQFYDLYCAKPISQQSIEKHQAFAFVFSHIVSWEFYSTTTNNNNSSTMNLNEKKQIIKQKRIDNLLKEYCPNFTPNWGRILKSPFHCIFIYQIIWKSYQKKQKNLIQYFGFENKQKNKNKFNRRAPSTKKDVKPTKQFLSQPVYTQQQQQQEYFQFLKINKKQINENENEIENEIENKIENENENEKMKEIHLTKESETKLLEIKNEQVYNLLKKFSDSESDLNSFICQYPNVCAKMLKQIIKSSDFEAFMRLHPEVLVDIL